ncbi:LamG-like jellyroll fold domain-containing protein [Paenibacillus xanthanilyticus]|uniref:LamG-like jellyroll fold domain-containing protein n=1 Tax=Paenibacillus xanthanilyticus TaxID=1783531 RepID=A0ABV8K9J2_9BACL
MHLRTPKRNLLAGALSIALLAQGLLAGTAAAAPHANASAANAAAAAALKTAAAPAASPYETVKRADGNNLVFPVISDIHINGSVRASSKFKATMEQINAIAPDYDALISVGDLTDNGTSAEYDELMSIYNGLKQPNAQHLFAIGNHDYYGSATPQAAQSLFKSKTGMDGLYYDRWLNGYHFIVIGSEDRATNGTLSDAQIEWLDAKLAENASPNKPIFVFFHQHISNTVYGSDLWGHTQNAAKLYSTLAKYPQAITFSGHSHYVLDDPRTAHQRDFTSFGTAAIRYPELEPGKVQGNHPTDDITQGYIVEVRDDKVLVKRRDFHANAWTGEDWVIDYPAMKSKFKYTDNRDTVKPAFPASAKATVVGGSVTETKFRLEFDQAMDNLNVHSYEIIVTNDKTGQKATSVLAFSDFYLDPVPAKLAFDIGGLTGDTAYTASVTAIDSFGNRSDKALTAKLTTGAKAPFTPPVADVIDIDFMDGTAKDVSGKGNDATPQGDVGIAYDPAFKKPAAWLKGRSSEFFAIQPSASIKSVTQTASIEALFKLNSIRDHAVFGNTQSGGLSFESTDDGNMELWLHAGGSYTRIGIPLETGVVHHLVGTYDGSAATLYHNGVKVQTQGVTGAIKQPDIPFAIGADPEANQKGNYVLDGSVSVARLYSQALTQEQVKYSYDQLAKRLNAPSFNTLHDGIAAGRALAADASKIGDAPGQYPASAMTAFGAALDQADAIMTSRTAGEDEAKQAAIDLVQARAALEAAKNGAAQTGAYLEGPAKALPGQTVALTYGIRGDAASRSVAQDITFEYAADKLQFLGFEAADQPKQGFQVVDTEDKDGKLRIIAATIPPAMELQGQLLQLRFKVKAGAASGTTALSVAQIVLADASGAEKTLPSPGAHTLTIGAAIDNAALLKLIQEASSLHQNAVEGGAIGQYPAGSRAVLQAAIAKAKQTADNAEATDADIAKAAAELELAVQTFKDSVNKSTAGDTNNDGKFSIGDLAIVAQGYGAASTDANWNDIKAYDFNADGRIGLEDMAYVARRILGKQA